MAHELNNPLTGVIGYCELLLESSGDNALKEKLGKVNNAALRCKKIIENLLSFARQHKIEKQYININDIVKHTLELKSYQLAIDNIDVVTELDSHLPYTMGDSYTLQQVFLNIVNNAHLSMREKGGKNKLTVKSCHNEGVITVYFTDTGIGIHDSNIKKIFDPFFTTREVGKGTGLGLSVSYGIIKEHNGEIYAKNMADGGATFIIELPVIAETEGIKQHLTQPYDLYIENHEKKKVLVIDDEQTILDLVKTVVEGMGLYACTASDGLIAMDKIKEDTYDLIISDIRMPNMDGKEFYRVIRRVRPEMLSRIIFTTGDTINPDTHKFLKESNVPYLEKPFSVASLKRLIADYFKSDARTA